MNQVGCLLGMQAVIPSMIEQGGGAIVNISSTCGLQGTAGLSAYVSSKFAIRGMTKTAAIELGPLKIRVNAICPGGIDTAMGRGDDFGSVDTSAITSWACRSRASAVRTRSARAAVFLASDESLLLHRHRAGGRRRHACRPRMGPTD